MWLRRFSCWRSCAAAKWTRPRPDGIAGPAQSERSGHAESAGFGPLAQQRLPDAETIFRGLAEKNPEFLAARRNLVQVLVAEQRPDDAKGVLQELVQKNPNDARALSCSHRSPWGKSSLTRRPISLKEAQKVTPKDPTPGMRLVQL